MQGRYEAVNVLEKSQIVVLRLQCTLLYPQRPKAVFKNIFLTEDC